MHMDIFIWTFLCCWQISKLGHVYFYRQALLIFTLKHIKGIKIKMSIAVVGSTYDGRLIHETHTRLEQLPKFLKLQSLQSPSPYSLAYLGQLKQMKSLSACLVNSLAFSYPSSFGREMFHEHSGFFFIVLCFFSFLVAFSSCPLSSPSLFQLGHLVRVKWHILWSVWLKSRNVWNSSFSQTLGTSALRWHWAGAMLWLYEGHCGRIVYRYLQGFMKHIG